MDITSCMNDCARGIEDFLSPLPQSPVPLEILEKAETESERVETIVPLKQRHHGVQPFIYEFTVTFDGTTYGLRFEDDEWSVIATSAEVEDVGLAMEKYNRENKGMSPDDV